MRREAIFVATVILFLSLFSNVSALTTIDSCQTLTSQGETYQLNKSVSINDSNCFTIQNDSITIDCSGFSINGNAGQSGVYAYNYNNIIIKNCDIEGFDNSIDTHNSNNTLIDNCTGTNSVQYSFGFCDNNNLLIKDTRAYSNTGNGFHMSSSCTSDNVTISNSISEDNSNRGFGVYPQNGIITNFTLEDSISRGNSQGDIYTNMNKVVFRNITKLQSSDTDSINIVNTSNLVIDDIFNNQSYTASSYAFQCYDQTCENIEIKNSETHSMNCSEFRNYFNLYGNFSNFHMHDNVWHSCGGHLFFDYGSGLIYNSSVNNDDIYITAPNNLGRTQSVFYWSDLDIFEFTNSRITAHYEDYEDPSDSAGVLSFGGNNMFVENITIDIYGGIYRPFMLGEYTGQSIETLTTKFENLTARNITIECQTKDANYCEATSTSETIRVTGIDNVLVEDSHLDFYAGGVQIFESKNAIVRDNYIVSNYRPLYSIISDGVSFVDNTVVGRLPKGSEPNAFQNAIYIYQSYNVEANSTAIENDWMMTYYPVYVYQSVNSTIYNMTMNNLTSYYGLNSRSSNYTIFREIDISGAIPYYGIRFRDNGVGGVIDGCSVNNSTRYGIYLSSGISDTTIRDTVINNTHSTSYGRGIYLEDDGYNTIEDSVIENSANYGIEVRSYFNTFNNINISESIGLDFRIVPTGTNMDECKQIINDVYVTEGKKLIYHNDTVSLSDESGAGEIILCNADGSTISNLNIQCTNNMNGLQTFYTDNLIADGIVAEDCFYGFGIWYADNISVNDYTGNDNRYDFSTINLTNSVLSNLEIDSGIDSAIYDGSNKAPFLIRAGNFNITDSSIKGNLSAIEIDGYFGGNNIKILDTDIYRYSTEGTYGSIWMRCTSEPCSGESYASLYNSYLGDYKIDSSVLDVYWEVTVENPLNADVKIYNSTGSEIESFSDTTKTLWLLDYRVEEVDSRTNSTPYSINYTKEPKYRAGSELFSLGMDRLLSISLVLGPVINQMPSITGLLVVGTGYGIIGILTILTLFFGILPAAANPKDKIKVLIASALALLMLGAIIITMTT